MKIFEKIVKYLTDILKFSAFVFFARWFTPCICLDSFIGFLDKFVLQFAENISWLYEPVCYILILYLYAILNFFCAKKMGVINFLSKFPFWYSLIIASFICTIIDYHQIFWFDNYFETWKYWIWYSWIVAVFLGSSFLNVYIAYKLAKFLIKKYPKKMGFLRYLYPKFLDKIPNIIISAITITLMLLLIPHVKKEADCYPDFLYVSSGDYFLYLMIFFFICQLIRLIFKWIKAK